MSPDDNCCFDSFAAPLTSRPPALPSPLPSGHPTLASLWQRDISGADVSGLIQFLINSLPLLSHLPRLPRYRLASARVCLLYHSVTRLPGGGHVAPFYPLFLNLTLLNYSTQRDHCLTINHQRVNMQANGFNTGGINFFSFFSFPFSRYQFSLILSSTSLY